MDLYTQIPRVESWHCGSIRRVGRQDQDMGFARDIAVACHGVAVLKFTLLAMDAAKLRCDIGAHPPTGDEPEDEEEDTGEYPVPEGAGGGDPNGGCEVRKIISLFQRNYDGDKLVRDELVPGAEWVAAGEGVATRKWDGTCCMVHDGKLFKRYDAKKGKKPPEGFEPAQDPDPATGHWPGWLPIGDGPEDRWHRAAFNDDCADVYMDGTYELVGPKVQGNPECFEEHKLIAHGHTPMKQRELFLNCPRDFEGIKAFLAANAVEGIVWHHPDGRMAKIKAKDFGLKRTPFEPVI